MTVAPPGTGTSWLTAVQPSSAADSTVTGAPTAVPGVAARPR